jgi:glucokinase
MAKNILVWDLGASKCAAAIVTIDTETYKFTIKNNCYIKLNTVSSLEELILSIEEKLKTTHKDMDVICIGAAGIYNGEYLYLDKGYPYPMPFQELAKKLSWPKFDIIHDYALIICATFTDTPVKKINAGEINPYERRIGFGVGSGLGLKDGILFPKGDFWLGSNEMGHIGILNPISAPSHLSKTHQRFTQNKSFSFEDILSGQGLVKIHQFLEENVSLKTPEEIGELMKENKAQETLKLFAFYLGLFVGTVQLSFMPSGGIWMTGGIISNYPQLVDQPEFFQGIESLPAYWEKRKTFPLSVFTDFNHVFLGGAYYASKRLV